ncbi:Mpo1 family 2-hydroxy fatty acid dioxygenase [Mucilaginibacter segetis]|uniref:DUF962 domain-containing protein n=1 Tax=Mucilaginibacter segetis TaxID=2793071 RepID=A0A934PSI2_9SPHI|nr:Mpo1-like protein [Mucilaginibacter segetis]MBK0378401.1 DUF962 domain-containing protein [Mucilaginibacter segetis]
MARSGKKVYNPVSPKKEDLRPVDVYFNRLNASHQQSTNLLLHFIGVPLMVLGALAIAWAIPFPHFSFIGKYNGYFNWASFLIAFWIYYTLKLSPMLSYLMLFLMFGFSYGVMELSAIEQISGIPLIWIGTFILALAALLQFIGGKTEGKPSSFNDDKQLVLITPIWVLHFLTKKIGIRY